MRELASRVRVAHQARVAAQEALVEAEEEAEAKVAAALEEAEQTVAAAKMVVESTKTAETSALTLFGDAPGRRRR